MSSKADLLKKQIAQLEVVMVNVFYWYTACTIEKKKAIVKQTAPKVIKRRKFIGNIEEIEATEVIKDLKLLGTLTPPTTGISNVPSSTCLDLKLHTFYMSKKSSLPEVRF